jgi:hypothetical protein
MIHPIHFHEVKAPSIACILPDTLLDSQECLLWYDKEDIESALLLHQTDRPRAMPVLLDDNTYHIVDANNFSIGKAESPSRNK